MERIIANMPGGLSSATRRPETAARMADDPAVLVKFADRLSTDAVSRRKILLERPLLTDMIADHDGGSDMVGVLLKDDQRAFAAAPRWRIVSYNWSQLGNLISNLFLRPSGADIGAALVS